MIKYLALLVPLLLLQGCIYQIVDEVDLLISDKVCSEHGGVKYILSDFTGRVNTKCSDGKYFYDDELMEVRDKVLSKTLKGE